MKLREEIDIDLRGVGCEYDKNILCTHIKFSKSY